MRLVIGIKAYNEEAKIAAALESALAAAAPFKGQVVLADCGSTDRTVEIARGYPVTIACLAAGEDRGCGVGAQLAWQAAAADCDYFYLLDGDMELDPDFLPAAVAFLEERPDMAGVGGRVIERNLEGQDFQVRAQKQRGFEGEVDRLDCGGLYRAEAVRAAGYFADRNLHAFEEFDLGARLAVRGGKLARLDRPGVYHYGHAMGGYALLWRRLRSGYAGGLGEVLRAAVGRPHLPVVLRRLWPLQMAFAILGWWIAILLLLIAGRAVMALLLIAAPIAILTVRRRSLPLALYSFAAWNVLAIGLVTGLFRPRIAPEKRLKAGNMAVIHCEERQNKERGAGKGGMPYADNR